jgi:hypothetical protein
MISHRLVIQGYTDMSLPKPLFLRALAVTAGTVVAVLPLLAVRILLVIGAESLQLDTGIWTKLFYLPYELIFPFVLSSSMLHQRPAISSSSLTLRTLLTSIASSPFVVAIFTLLISLAASGDQSFLTTLATILGLAPFLGVLGLAGFLFICFPLTIFGGGIAMAADYFIYQRYCKAIERICFEQQFNTQTLSLRQRVKLSWQRLAARFTKRKSIQHYTDVILKEEFERYRQPIFTRLGEIAGQLSEREQRTEKSSQIVEWEAILTRLRHQLLFIEQKTLRFHELLKLRLHVEELTFYRYSASVKNVYYAVMEQLDKVSKALTLEIATQASPSEQRHRKEQLDENDRAIQSIDELIAAILTLPHLPAHKATSLTQSLVDLEQMIQRIGDYRH